MTRACPRPTIGGLVAAPIHLAALASSGAAAVLTVLLRHGADVDAGTAPCGRTPLHLAAAAGGASRGRRSHFHAAMFALYLESL